MASPTAEEQRLSEAKEHTTARPPLKDNAKNWRLWGTYLSDRQWGTVREDYSSGGNAWEYFPHDHARSRAYRWGEDGIGGFSDEKQRLCFALALWNGQDAILKERYFGLTNSEGNHGEDIKEYHFYSDNTPTHSYAKMVYKYPQKAFPYADLVEENARRKGNPRSFEYELLDTGVFAENRYFDVTIEFAKKSATDTLIQISVANRGPDAATAHLLPTLWFRNTWSWFKDAQKPELLHVDSPRPGVELIRASKIDEVLGEMSLYCESPQELLFTENETNTKRLYNQDSPSPHTKDAFHRYLINGENDAVNPAKVGTKAAARYDLTLAPGEEKKIRLRLTDNGSLVDPFGPDFDATFTARIREADEFYGRINARPTSDDHRLIQRQAFAGMLWCKQFFYYVIADWLSGDDVPPPPPPERKKGRNKRWIHYYSEDVLSMPDAWEYPWFASWDMAFHTIVLSLIDPEFAKRQLTVLAGEWQMNPDGQVPAYEWSFDDVNPPLHAWAAWRIYKIEGKMTGKPDRRFLKSIFHRCLMYFTWWLNRKDRFGDNLFSGGFLGMDNIGIFDRNKVPQGYDIAQADGTGWMGMFALVMLKMAVELAEDDEDYYSLAVKLFQNFVYIADSLNNFAQIAGCQHGLWDERDGFFYDVLRKVDGAQSDTPMKVRTFVGFVPLFAIETLDKETFDKATSAGSNFSARINWFIKKHPKLAAQVLKLNERSRSITFDPKTSRIALSLVDENRLRSMLTRMLDEKEFFGPHGIRTVSKVYEQTPYTQQVDGTTYNLQYTPAESITGDFGGNSNWRGPVWIQVNFLLIESLQRFHYWLGDSYKVECPTGSGKLMNLWEVAAEISKRLVSVYERDENDRRPVYGGIVPFQTDPHWKNHLLFFEYFHGDNGAGLGASHQTGWTGLTAKLIQQLAEHPTTPSVVSK